LKSKSACDIFKRFLFYDCFQIFFFACEKNICGECSWHSEKIWISYCKKKRKPLLASIVEGVVVVGENAYLFVKKNRKEKFFSRILFVVTKEN
jgi:hypothetical protein